MKPDADRPSDTGRPPAADSPPDTSHPPGSAPLPGTARPPDTGRRRVVVFASGNGSNLQALLDAAGAPGFCASVVAVISDRADAFALARAGRAAVPAIALPRQPRQKRADYDAMLARTTEAYAPDIVFLLGWMRLLSNTFLSRFPGRVLNLHPALPGTFPGLDAIGRALEAYRAGTINCTGVMTHYVPDEGVDSGPLIASTVVRIFPDDSRASLEARIHEAERLLVVDTINRIFH